ncbi:glycosyltransferase family 4 protein [Candidatus Woesearchaeota archaeon]|nr:glycosyltransferase family 4 protein [Candidatus Woesearchaeota archaeon]
MKILETPAYFLPHIGGIESVVYSLSKEWIKLKHKVKIITSSIGSDKTKEIMEDIKVGRIKSFTFIQDAIAPLLPFSLHSADIAHIHHPHPYWMFVCASYFRIKKVPYVVHMHGKEIVYTGWKKWIAIFYNYFFLDFILRRSEKIISHTIKVIPQSQYLRKYKNKIVCIPHGTDLMHFKKIKRSNFIFSVGIRDYKRLDILIRSMPLILKKVKTRLVIAGKGKEKDKLEKLIEKLGLQEEVIFLGYITEGQKYGLYQKAGVFILPSPTIMESFGTVAFEALSMKCPTIVTSGAGISEIFEKEKIGIIVQPYKITELAEQIVKLLKNKKLANEIGEKGYKVIEKKYQWKHIAKKYIEIFEEVIKNARAN